uniref:Uncharacterized protein n=1 Tax=Chrysotila carterae TaxID=13221 RepID=A0A7S4AYY0_CHRCT
MRGTGSSKLQLAVLPRFERYNQAVRFRRQRRRPLFAHVNDSACDIALQNVCSTNHLLRKASTPQSICSAEHLLCKALAVRVDQPFASLRLAPVVTAANSASA